MTDLPEGWAESTITVRYPVDELEEVRAYCAKHPEYLDPDAYTVPGSKLSARLRAAALEQIPAPQRTPKRGDVWRYKSLRCTRLVKLVDDGYVYLGPSGGYDPTVWSLDEFLAGYEFVS